MAQPMQNKIRAWIGPVGSGSSKKRRGTGNGSPPRQPGSPAPDNARRPSSANGTSEALKSALARNEELSRCNSALKDENTRLKRELATSLAYLQYVMQNTRIGRTLKTHNYLNGIYDIDEVDLKAQVILCTDREHKGVTFPFAAFTGKSSRAAIDALTTATGSDRMDKKDEFEARWDEVDVEGPYVRLGCSG